MTYIATETATAVILLQAEVQKAATDVCLWIYNKHFIRNAYCDFTDCN